MIFLKKYHSLRSRCLEVMRARKDGVLKGAMWWERKCLPKRPMKIISPLPIQLPGNHCMTENDWPHTNKASRPALEKLCATKNRAREVDSHVSLACPILSCAHYFKVPATQARNIKLKTPRIALTVVLESKLLFGVCPQSPLVADTFDDWRPWQSLLLFLLLKADTFML